MDDAEPFPADAPPTRSRPSFASSATQRTLRKASPPLIEGTFRPRPAFASLLEESSSSADYFGILSQSVQPSPVSTRPGTPTFEAPSDASLHQESFVQGYYARFFRVQ
jgi:hypothetical protein